MSIRICIGGRIGAGKTSVAKLLEQYYHLQRFSFVTPIRQEISEAFGVTMEELTEAGKKERYRALLVAWGPARNVSTGDAHYWAKKLLERIPQIDDVVVDDLRRPEEFDHLCTIAPPDNWVMVWLDVAEQRCRDYLVQSGVTDPRQLDETLNAVTEVSLLPYVAGGKFDIVLDANRSPEAIYRDLVAELLHLGVPLDDPDLRV